jgi:hypothetical protein
VTAWLGRGIVWTLAFELLLVALSPLELALWSTGRGERLSRRFEAKRALLDHHSPRRRMGRRAALAAVALAVSCTLMGLGVARHIPSVVSPAPAAAKVTRVTRVVRVVKPVRVERVVRIKTVSEQVPVASTYPQPAAQVHTVVKHRPAPAKHVAAKKPSSTPKTAPVDPTAQTEAPTSPTVTSPQTTPAPTTDTTSGAAAQPTT